MAMPAATSATSIPDPNGNGVWISAETADGRSYWVNHTTQSTSWHPPVVGGASLASAPSAPQRSSTLLTGNSAEARAGPPVGPASASTMQRTYTMPSYATETLPPGWEKRTNADGKPYYVDHNTRSTHWFIPAEARSTVGGQAAPSAPPPAAAGGNGRRLAALRPGAAAAAAGGGSGGMSSVNRGMSGLSMNSTPSYRSTSSGVSRTESVGPRSYSGIIPEGLGGAERLAIECAECVVCFDEMWKEQSGVFTKRSGRRCCPHLLHLKCAEDVRDASRGGKHCPVCRAEFHDVKPVPLIGEQPSEWFAVVDLNGDGTLSKRDVCEVLKAQLPIDYQRLEREIDGMWPRWDADGSGTVSKAEFLAPRVGLLAYVNENFPSLGGEAEPVPDIRRDKEAWFRYFDDDDSDSLEQSEIVRALIKTFRLSDEVSKVRELRDTVANIWPLFDHDGNGGICMTEFCKPGDGLADTIIASLSMYGG